MSDGADVVFALLGFAVLFGVGCLLGSNAANTRWELETVSRGVAIYCPLDGSWAWNDECKAPLWKWEPKEQMEEMK